ncbi:NADH dehydrogenase (ubiquinone), putative [Acanthamoeba castellanii str. Neff]|uniref:NADH dehydrogenase (Ubiquinone), putative n=1 Tax=Acanthamoeba castellanii (strain ATCC 30010 / Neff) TaxID=1257118 RepID=L8H842_ACACF|nr:NADH dehydrogenase (ubiquinone), putative [Acanthamoeba castellanii str. Neff]ELR20908.1 NADH dehydrogenase (ubiquinone), putative [Acanthamoeba castellanii str. Neff]
MRRAAPQLSRGMLPAYGRSSSSLLASRATLSSTASRAASSLKLKIPFLGDTEIALKDDVFRPGVPENPGNLYAPMPAEELIHEIPPKVTHGSTAVCDGGGGALGHPRIFINLDKPGPHDCGYCGLRFIKEEEHH